MIEDQKNKILRQNKIKKLGKSLQVQMEENQRVLELLTKINEDNIKL